MDDVVYDFAARWFGQAFGIAGTVLGFVIVVKLAEAMLRGGVRAVRAWRRAVRHSRRAAKAREAGRRARERAAQRRADREIRELLRRERKQSVAGSR